MRPGCTGSRSPKGGRHAELRVGGLGIVQTGGVLVTKAWLHAVFQVRVYDGRTLEFLGWKPATSGQNTFMAMIKGPHREVDGSWWPEKAKVEADVRLKSAMRELVEQALSTTYQLRSTQ